MITNYPYIFIGIMVILIPIALIGGMIAGMLFLMTGLTSNDLTYSYDYLNNSTESILVVYPSYTYFANHENSLADIGKMCDGCESYMTSHGNFLTTSLGFSETGGSLGRIANEYFTYATDYYLEHDIASIKLEDYDKVILMRNVYTTDNFRTMILNHTNVVYMFPDALTKEVFTNSTYTPLSYTTQINMTYVGDIEPLHPMAHEWADDNRCEDWEFVRVINGYMMNCTSDVALINNHDMLMEMRDISTNSAHESFQKFSKQVALCSKYSSIGPSTDCIAKRDITTDFNNATGSNTTWIKMEGTINGSNN